LWAVGTLFTLVTIALLEALLVVNRAAVKWEDLLARERIEQVALFIGIAVSVTTLIVLLAIGGASLGWTGFADKTLWEWLQLLGTLAIPVVLAVAGLWFTAQQDQRQVTTENERARQAQKIEDHRAAADQEIAKQRARDESLEAYLDQMSHLLLEKHLRSSKEDSVVRTLARARTATVLQRLDGPRNRNVIRFLNEAQLIGQGESSIHLLAEADLQGAGLHRVDLSAADLSGANLSGANLTSANLIDTDLSGANLEHANLSWAGLDDTTNLKHTELAYAELRGADLYRVNLSRAGGGSWLKEVDLQDAFLQGADLHGAYLISADLQDAWLNGADLHGAIVEDTDLSGAYGVTQEQLASCKSLRSSTMPDGQTLKGYKKGTRNGPTFEEWLKDKEARKKAGKDE